MKQYIGRLLKGIPLVYVIQVDGDSRLLEHRANYGHVHEWGVRGHGSLQLAYDMLRDVTGDDKMASSLQHSFQRRYIAPLALGHGWRMTEGAVLKAVAVLAHEQN